MRNAVALAFVVIAVAPLVGIKLGTYVGEGQSHGSTGDSPVSRTERSGRIELFCR